MTDYFKELKPGEPHPVSFMARSWIAKLDPEGLGVTQLALANAALSGNRSAQICSETLDRLLRGDTVSDRYVLGLAWFLMELQKNEKKKVG